MLNPTLCEVNGKLGERRTLVLMKHADPDPSNPFLSLSNTLNEVHLNPPIAHRQLNEYTQADGVVYPSIVVPFTFVPPKNACLQPLNVPVLAASSKRPPAKAKATTRSLSLSPDEEAEEEEGVEGVVVVDKENSSSSTSAAATSNPSSAASLALSRFLLRLGLPEHLVRSCVSIAAAAMHWSLSMGRRRLLLSPSSSTSASMAAYTSLLHTRSSQFPIRCLAWHPFRQVFAMAHRMGSVHVKTGIGVKLLFHPNLPPSFSRFMTCQQKVRRQF